MDKIKINREELEREIQYTFSRSSGKGGQNVNKVNTKVELTFDLNLTKIYSVEEVERIKAKLIHLINKEGQIKLQVQEERSQLENKEIAINKLIAQLKQVNFTPKKRIKTKPNKGSVENRLQSKKIQSLLKESRRKL